VDRDGNGISLVAFQKLTKDGCSWCSEIPIAAESEFLTWLDYNSFVCHECAEAVDSKGHSDSTDDTKKRVH
jgi:hypothetical protein